MIINDILSGDESFTSSQRLSNTDPLWVETRKRPRTFGNEYRRSRNLSRYNNAIKNLIPIRTLKTSEDEMPVDNAGFFSTIFFSWITKYLQLSYHKGINISDLPKPSPYDTADYNTKRLEALWNEEVMRHSLAGASFSRAAWKFIRTRIFISAIIFGCSVILGFLGPAIVMRKLLEYVESSDGSIYTGIMWLFLLMISDLTRVALFNWGWSTCYRTGLRLKSAYLTTMYRKLIKSKNLNNRDSGKYINMMANDSQNAFDLCIFTPMMIAGPIITILIVSYILYVLSPIALVGFLFFFSFYPLQYLICRLTGYFKRKSISLSDERVSAINEILNCIKLIKMYAWEDPFRLNLLDLRKKEKLWLEKMTITRSYGSSLTTTIPIISAIITFLAHVAGGHNLVAAQVFPFVLLLNSQTRHIISFFEIAITTTINAKLSFGRMKSVMCIQEVNCYIQKPIVKNQAVTIINGTFTCDIDAVNLSGGNKKKKKKSINKLDGETDELSILMPKRIEILNDIMFEAPKSKLIGICGHVGSGKSSLLKAALGHLRMTNGKVSRDVTHQIPYLSHCDQIYMMDNGRIVEHGNHVSLIQAGKQYYSMVKNIMANNKSIDDADDYEMILSNEDNLEFSNKIGNKYVSNGEKTMDINEKNDDGTLIHPENMERGRIKSETYLMYINAMGGFFIMTIVLINVFLNSGCVLFSNWWLAHWIKAGSGGINITIGNETFISENIIDNPDLGYYQMSYGICIVAIVGSSLLRGFSLTRTALGASSNLHNKVFKQIINTSMQFFETTTRGRLQNIFSRDISELDGQLPLVLEQVLSNIVHGVLNILIVCFILPYLTIPFIILSLIFYFVAKLFRRALRDLQRHESVTRSPIFSLATTTLQGLDTIHAFEKESEFIDQFNKCIDINGTCNFLSNVLLRWAAIRFDFLTIFAYLCTGFTIVCLKGHISSAMAGLALSFCGQMTGFLQYTIRLLSQTELKFISVERIGFYLKTLKDEDSNTKAALVELKREKLGIAGRTGSGKSSLISALFRLVELHNGCIKIDDPWKVKTDEELWIILEKTNLKNKVRSMHGQLGAIVDSGDSNLSMGERQLLCLARALLRKSKIIILDEATASVDPHTEHIVQMAIQKEFADCTILTIAHRLQTILSCDRIIVMDGGKIIEFDSPQNLIENHNSEFSKMLTAADKTTNGL
ncbi:hypothetical protein PV327_000119 [Microctonus hyperodae]|uniref:Uncharacterized protein n=1 Tax=Microctonus hyperodae TaxID=165561 RepID=A0AA39G602_MICHY|nr:hypothetical protein PV327_000119 [Microctonus hyperodae]